MAEESTLSGPEIAPAGGSAPDRLVVLRHGVGADGNDLIGLAREWAASLPGAHFVAPNGPEPFDMAPVGRQWFSLGQHNPQDLLAGIQRAAPLVDAFIDAELARFGLGDDRLALVGFSQGTMVALYVALRRRSACAAVLGYSGTLVGAERLDEEIRARPPVLLVHGDSDEVVPAQAMMAAALTLGTVEVSTQWHICRGVGHGIDPEGLSLGGRFLVDAFAEAG